MKHLGMDLKIGDLPTLRWRHNGISMDRTRPPNYIYGDLMREMMKKGIYLRWIYDLGVFSTFPDKPTISVGI
jgi:hypothetical protein